MGKACTVTLRGVGSGAKTVSDLFRERRSHSPLEKIAAQRPSTMYASWEGERTRIESGLVDNDDTLLSETHAIHVRRANARVGINTGKSTVIYACAPK